MNPGRMYNQKSERGYKIGSMEGSNGIGWAVGSVSKDYSGHEDKWGRFTMTGPKRGTSRRTLENRGYGACLAGKPLRISGRKLSEAGKRVTGRTYIQRTGNTVLNEAMAQYFRCGK